MPIIFGLGASDIDLEEFDDLRKNDGARHDDHVVPDAIPVQHSWCYSVNISVQEQNEQDDQEFMRNCWVEVIKKKNHQFCCITMSLIQYINWVHSPHT